MSSALFLDLKHSPAYMDDIRVIDFRSDNSKITQTQVNLLIGVSDGNSNDGFCTNN